MIVIETTEMDAILIAERKNAETGSYNLENNAMMEMLSTMIVATTNVRFQ